MTISRYLKCLILIWRFTVVSKIIGPPEFSQLDPIVSKSCNIECCGNKVYQIMKNMILSQAGLADLNH